MCHLLEGASRAKKRKDGQKRSHACFWALWICCLSFWRGRPRVVSAHCVPTGGCSLALAYYTVGKNDVLYDIALRFGTTYPAIQEYSNFSDPDHIDPGQELLVPYRCDCNDNELSHLFSYAVQQNDDVQTIAHEKFGNLSKVEWITAANPSQNVGSINAGMVLSIPVNCSCGNPQVSKTYGLFATYVIEEHDTLASLSKKFNISSKLLEDYNSVVWTNIQADESIIFIPAKDDSGKYPPFNNSAAESETGSRGMNKGVLVGASIGGAIMFSVLAGLGLFYLCAYLPKKPGKSSIGDKQEDPLVVDMISSAYTSSTPAVFSEQNEHISGRSLITELANFTVDKSVQFSYEELAAATDNFSVGKEVGRGGFGSVYYGEIRGQRLAIKRMNLKAKREFVSELNILTRVHHTNLVRLVGYCAADSLLLAYEFIDNGTLSQHLRGAGRGGNPPLTWASRIQIALDAARGLEYIHEHTTPTYIHRDIKSSNILLDKNLHAKVADFGLTKFTSSDGTPTTEQTKLVGTFGYIAPEYAQSGHVSPKTDVYAFGVVLYEIISARDAIVYDMEGPSAPDNREGNRKGLARLFEDVFNDPEGKLKLQSLMDPALGNQYPLESVWKMANLARACTKEEPMLRPNMRTVVVALMTLASSNQNSGMDSFSENYGIGTFHLSNIHM